MDKRLVAELAQLESTLTQSADRHEQLLSLMRRQREAMRQAQADQVADLSRQENAVVQAISALEKRRLELVASLTQTLSPQAAQPMRMRVLAEQLPEPARGRLLVLRQKLRERMEAVKEESSVSRRASESLLSHMQGLVQSLSHVSARGAGYDRPGRQRQSLPAIGTISLTA
ncbi:MAG: flagellar protein FlgN [Phycisphaerales bacterium JB063]